ncbi:MAG TPA: DNA polymerase domain-containing protein [Polyangiaceae bacterium]|nr:DNA polymerase domain-containing protein [Polyangiaceae bacterium]
MTSREDEWLHGWDATPGIVSVWAEPDGRALVWRRDRESKRLVRETAQFRPWLLLATLTDVQHLGARLEPHTPTAPPGAITYEELEGTTGLRYCVRGPDVRQLRKAVLRGASQRLGRSVDGVRELGADQLLVLPPEEQYLVATGRTYFRGLDFDDVRRLQFDLETTGLDPDVDRVFLIALRTPEGEHELLEAAADDDDAEAQLLRRLAERIAFHDPDVIENHNLHGFDLPFVMRRAERLRLRLSLGRPADVDFALRPSSRGARLGQAGASWLERLRRARYTLPGRELLDSMDAVRRHDFSARDLPGHGLKAVARHFGLATEDREYIPGARVYQTFLSDPERVRRYAADDVHEAAGVARLLGGAAFTLSQMAPRRYERLADAGAATGVLDPLMVRAYLRAKAALPAHEGGDGTLHQGAALYLFASGVATRIVKADVASLYPSLMRQYRIGPKRDRLGVFLAIVDRLVERRLAAKAAAREASPGSTARFQLEAVSAAIKLVVNSAYGYLGAVGLTRFADVHAANEITRRGRELLSLMCRELAERDVQLLEADTDGVYFAVPEGFAEADERRVVAEVAALLPPLVDLQFEGRYQAMLSHEPKNYALAPYPKPGPGPGGGELVLRGVAFRSSRSEPFGEEFLRKAIARLLAGDLHGVRAVYVSTLRQLRTRQFSTFDVCSRVRLTKTPEQYLGTRGQRQELPYEAMLANGRDHWSAGERAYVYRRTQGRAGLWVDEDTTTDADAHDAGASFAPRADPRDYDVEHYARQLQTSFASRLARGLEPEDYEAIVADPDRPSLFQRPLAASRPILSVLQAPEPED